MRTGALRVVPTLARGDIVGFPDDDCIFPAGLLARVTGAFAVDPADV